MNARCSKGYVPNPRQKGWARCGLHEGHVGDCGPARRCAKGYSPADTSGKEWFCGLEEGHDGECVPLPTDGPFTEIAALEADIEWPELARDAHDEAQDLSNLFPRPPQNVTLNFDVLPTTVSVLLCPDCLAKVVAAMAELSGAPAPVAEVSVGHTVLRDPVEEP